MTLSGSLSGSHAGSLGGGLGGGDLIDIKAALGADLLHWWEVPSASDPLITIVSGNVSQLNDRVGSAHLTQATEGSRPLYHASGGPSNQPFCELHEVARKMDATINLSAGNRVGLFVVGAHAASPGATRELASLWESPATDRCRLLWDGDQFWHVVAFTGGTQSLVLTAPAGDTAWHLFGLIPASTGALSQIDGATTTADFTGTDTVTASTRFSVGGRTGTIGHGSFAAAFLVVDPTPAKVAILQTYVEARWGSSPNAIVLAGQSNAFNLTIEDLGTVNHYDWLKVAAGGVSLAVDWAAGADLRDVLIANVQATPGAVAIPWAQGESDCANPAFAAAYASNVLAFADDVEDAAGRDDLLWVVCQLHEDLTLGTSGDRNLVRAGLAGLVASRPGRAVLLDPSDGGELFDGVHWDAATRLLMASRIRAAVMDHA